MPASGGQGMRCGQFKRQLVTVLEDRTMMKTLEKLFGEGCSGAFHVGGRSAAILFVFTVAVFVSQKGWGYRKLGPDRVLLMNNDTNSLSPISCQGYNDTDKTKETYWVHSTETGYARLTYLKPGITHTLYRNDGTPLWHLAGCRAGSCTVSATGRNYISWSKSSESITTPGAYGFTDVKGVGSVIFRNTKDATLYSPFYEDGIGTIYFDAVNSFATVPVVIGLEVATNAV